MRVWDVLRTIAWARDEIGVSTDRVEIHGRGEAGVIGLYAALLESETAHVVLGDPPDSHRQGPALLTILRHTDIPDVAAALAPRQLSLLGSRSYAFQSTQQAYELVSAANQFAVKASLAEAILEARTIKYRPSAQDVNARTSPC